MTVAEKIKCLQQRPNQSVAALIAYLDSLEEEWSEPLQESVRVSNFLVALHEYIRDEIRGRQMPTETRKQAHEAAFLIEKTVKRPAKAATKPTGKFRSQTTVTEASSDLVGAVATPPPKPPNKRKRGDDKSDKKDKSNIECWGCHQKRHYQNQCPTTAKKAKDQ